MKSNKLIIIFALIILFISFLFYYYDNNDNKKESNEENKRTDIVMSLKKGTLTTEDATFTITNNTDDLYYYGASYLIEVYKNNKWTELKPDSPLSWNMIAYSLKPRTDAEININWSYGYGTLKKGKYRLVKSFNKDDDSKRSYIADKDSNVYAEFEIK